MCDDEQSIREYLVRLIQNYVMMQGYDMEVVLETESAEKILAHKITQSQRSIYFLDVDLKDEKYDGFTLAKQIRAIDTRGFIIFVTTHDELVFETFKYRLEAMNYIIKDATNNLNHQLGGCLDEINLLISRENNDDSSYYTVSITNDTYHIPIQEIICFETAFADHRVLLHTQKQSLEFRGDLRAIEKELKGGFCRVHQSYLVQVSKILQVNYKKGLICLENGVSCLMSRKGKTLLKTWSEEKDENI